MTSNTNGSKLACEDCFAGSGERHSDNCEIAPSAQVLVVDTHPLKDTGRRETDDDGMVREPDADMPDFTLIFPEGIPFEFQPMVKFAQHMANGAKKYSHRNWEHANSPAALERYKRSLWRHVTALQLDLDDEDHASAAMFNIMAIVFLKYKLAQNA